MLHTHGKICLVSKMKTNALLVISVQSSVLLKMQWWIQDFPKRGKGNFEVFIWSNFHEGCMTMKKFVPEEGVRPLPLKIRQ